ncbi:hypothetical protein [Nonomuraea sp. NPDC050202]|uniref:hypothetical protein n=1 Tax=Nonomuraea sp. NPDC050202 TaxID=3155035 RepID=UPI0033CBF55D
MVMASPEGSVAGVMATAARRTVVATTLIGLSAATACVPPRGSAGRFPSPWHGVVCVVVPA